MVSLVYIFTGILGAVIGSFLNVAIYRIPRGESLIAPRSHCPLCQSPVRFFDNIPLISFVLLGGRCRSCRGRISWRYPLVEGINAYGYLLILHTFGFRPDTVVYALLFSSLLVVTFIDLSHKIVPDLITLPGILIGVVAGSTVLPVGLWGSVMGLFLGGGLFYGVAVLSRGGMGGGDIKLVAMIGAFLGWREVLLTIFVAAVAGSFVGLFLIFFAGKTRKHPIPFGPFLSLGAIVSLFWGRGILGWYLGIS